MAGHWATCLKHARGRLALLPRTHRASTYVWLDDPALGCRVLAADHERQPKRSGSHSWTGAPLLSSTAVIALRRLIKQRRDASIGKA